MSLYELEEILARNPIVSDDKAIIRDVYNNKNASNNINYILDRNPISPWDKHRIQELISVRLSFATGLFLLANDNMKEEEHKSA